MTVERANVVVQVPGRYGEASGGGRLVGHAVVELDPALPEGTWLSRLVEVRLYGQPPRLVGGRLRCPFWLEFHYLAAGPVQDGPRAAGVEVQLVGTVPPGVQGPAWIDRLRTACTGGGISRDRRSLLAHLQLAVGLGAPAETEEAYTFTWTSSPQSDPPTLPN